MPKMAKTAAVGLDEILMEYCSFLKEHAPVVAKHLRKGRSVDEVRNQLEEWALPLPETYFPLFTVLDGQKTDKVSLLPDFERPKHGLELAGIEEMGAWRNSFSGQIYLCGGLSWYKSFRNSPEIRAEFWLDDWLPFASGRSEIDGLYVDLFIDLSPAQKGKMGQIVANRRMVDGQQMHLQRSVIAESLTVYFLCVVAALKSGNAIFQSSAGILSK